MKVTDIISDKINRLPADYVFTYDDFNQQVDKIDALTKTLSRMVQEGRIRKLTSSSHARCYIQHQRYS